MNQYRSYINEEGKDVHAAPKTEGAESATAKKGPKKASQTYLKIPVNDQQAVANALKGLSALAAMFLGKNV